MIMSKEDEIFIQRILPKLTPNDIYVLHSLRDKTSTQIGITRKDIKKLIDKSEFDIFLSINRLELLELICSLKVRRTNQYSITELGLKVLEILSA